MLPQILQLNALKFTFLRRKYKNFQRLGPQTPLPPAAWGFDPRPPSQPPHCEILSTFKAMKVGKYTVNGVT